MHTFFLVKTSMEIVPVSENSVPIEKYNKLRDKYQKLKKELEELKISKKTPRSDWKDSELKKIEEFLAFKRSNGADAEKIKVEFAKLCSDLKRSESAVDSKIKRINSALRNSSQDEDVSESELVVNQKKRKVIIYIKKK